jgi:hypothetical protein
MTNPTPTPSASDVVRETLKAIVKQTTVGKPGSGALRSRYGSYPSALYHRAIAALAATPPTSSDAAVSETGSGERVWLIWATQGEYSDRNEWPISVGLSKVDAEQRTDRLGQLWRHLCAEYKRREDELDAAGDWVGKAIYETDEGREFLLIGGTESHFGSYAEDRMYTCSEVPVIHPTSSPDAAPLDRRDGETER